MEWSDIGEWIKKNAGPGTALVGSLLTGNVHGAIASGIALVKTATGVDAPAEVLQRLQTDPTTMIRLKELASQDEENIRTHIREMEGERLKDEQEAHRQQQETIRNGDSSADPYVRQTRPLIARQSWWGTLAYVIGFELLKAFKPETSGPEVEIALLLIAPAGAYMGFRTADRIWGKKNGSKSIS
ncbi:hypothetical protein UFOVP580_9 [uncultured Caudovirales phage]|uniref:Holin of 3TMs, for gene-transfer release n=1 Tax=uncultured Caudovirales phage TaxID=2100421 RepID=A0A6J5PC24_9CAUD|nr:hypothetical protein UFOVP580_9 [uncultured Caudovirales phage]